ncbi:MAG: SDR family oxidoreductase [Lautropia sp.]
MDLGIRGKTALVGGASQGIGYAIAHLLAEEGATVAMVARKPEPLAEACARITADTGARTVAIAADIRKREDCERIVQEALAALPGIDLLINNDGAPPLGKLDTFDDLAWQRAVEQNLMSVVRLCRGFLPGMRSRGFGRIVNMTALSVLQPIPEFGLSVASWAGVLGYAKTLSLEAAADGVTVNTICPGRFATGRVAKVYGVPAKGGRPDPEALAKMARELQIPVGRIGDPREIAGLVGFLCSSFAGYMTGHALHVDGGRRASLA